MSQETITYRGFQHWKLNLATLAKPSALLILALMSGVAAVVIAEITGTFGLSLRDPPVLIGLLAAVSAISITLCISLTLIGFINRTEFFRRAGAITLASTTFSALVVIISFLIISVDVRVLVLRLAALACLVIIPPSLFFVFLAMRKQSLLNAYVANLSRLGLLERRHGGPLQHEESEWCRLCRIGSYFERFSAYYGGISNSSLKDFFTLSNGQRAESGKAEGGKSGAQEGSTYTAEFFPLVSAGRPTSYDLRTVFPVIASVIPLSIGWLLVLPPAGLWDTPPSAPIWPLSALIPQRTGISFAFLGAYFLSLQMLVRRFITKDLGPNAYTTMSQRIILAIIAVWVLDILSFSELEEWSKKTFYALAFLLGAFPVVIWQIAAQLVKKHVGSWLAIPSLQTGRALGELSGLTVWHEVRLEEEDIESVEGMASADIVELLLSTKFPPHRIVDWVDESLLFLNLPPVRIAEDQSGNMRTCLQHPLEGKLAEFGIRTSTGLILAYYGSRQATAATSTTATVLPPPLMDAVKPMIVEIILHPNFRHVAHWKGLTETLIGDLLNDFTMCNYRR